MLDRFQDARNKKRSPWLLVIALALFLAFTYVAIRHLPPIDKPIRWSLVLLAGLVCVPFGIALNALEYRLMAHLADHHPPRLEILQVTIMGTAANLLPIPGAVVVRLANLNKGGVKVTRGFNLTAIIGITWVGAACMLGGIAELFSHPDFAVTALAIGVGLLAIAIVMLTRIVDKGARLAGIIELVAIETGFVFVQAARLFLIAAALRFNVSFAQASTLVIAAVTAAAIGFLPAGLGAREAIAALLVADRRIPRGSRSRDHRGRPRGQPRDPVDVRGRDHLRDAPAATKAAEALALDLSARSLGTATESRPRYNVSPRKPRPRRRPRVSSTSRRVVDDVVVGQIRVIDAQHHEVGRLELLDRAVDAGHGRSERRRRVGHVGVVHAHVGAERASRSKITIAGASRQSGLPGLYARPSNRMRAPFTERCCAFSIVTTRPTT